VQGVEGALSIAAARKLISHQPKWKTRPECIHGIQMRC
jgi:hypothetical protein